MLDLDSGSQGVTARKVVVKRDHDVGGIDEACAISTFSLSKRASRTVCHSTIAVHALHHTFKPERTLQG